MTSFAFQGRAVVNWFAAAAMVVFIVALVRQRTTMAPFAAGMLAGVAVVIADIASMRAHNLSFPAFGGIATYPLTAFVLAYLAVAYVSAEQRFGAFSAFVSAALAINSVDHLGAELISPAPTPRLAVVLQLATMFLIALSWLSHLLRSRSRRHWPALVVACFVGPFVVALCIRLATGSYRGFQQSGAVGVGRLAAVALLAYGAVASQIFSDPAHHVAATAAA